MEKKRIKRGRIALVVLLVALVITVTVTGLYYLQEHTVSQEEWDNLALTGTYHEGITIDGISVGGMSQTQARMAVREKMNARMDMVRISLLYGDQTFELTRDDFVISDNIDFVLEQAFRVAREGSRVDIQNQIEEIAETGLAFSTEYTVNPEPVKGYLKQIAASIGQPATDAAILINKEDRKNRFEYTDEVSGIAVDEQALYAAVEEQVRRREYGNVQIPVYEVPAAVTKKDLQASTAQRVISTTSFARSPYNRDSRVANLKKAAGIINGTVLAPGESFSTNTVLGPRTYELGWHPAPAIVRGGSEDQAGGGVCQVSTTMYNAVLKADLEIVDRRAHSLQLSYVEGGLDATINTGTIDFVYRNNTDMNVYIFSWVDSGDKKIHFEIYRQAFPDEYDEIRLSSERVETLYPGGELLVTVDPTKPAGYKEQVVSRRNGAVYKTWKHFYKNGKEVGKPQLVAKTTYKAYTGEMIVGPEPKPTRTPAPAINPTPIPTPTAKPDPDSEQPGDGGIADGYAGRRED